MLHPVLFSLLGDMAQMNTDEKSLPSQSIHSNRNKKENLGSEKSYGHLPLETD